MCVCVSDAFCGSPLSCLSPSATVTEKLPTIKKSSHNKFSSSQRRERRRKKIHSGHYRNISHHRSEGHHGRGYFAVPPRKNARQRRPPADCSENPQTQTLPLMWTSLPGPRLDERLCFPFSSFEWAHKSWMGRLHGFLFTRRTRHGRRAIVTGVWQKFSRQPCQPWESFVCKFSDIFVCRLLAWREQKLLDVYF